MLPFPPGPDKAQGQIKPRWLALASPWQDYALPPDKGMMEATTSELDRRVGGGVKIREEQLS